MGGGLAARPELQGVDALHSSSEKPSEAPLRGALAARELCWCFFLQGGKLVLPLSVTFLSSWFPKCGKTQTQSICTKLVNFNQVVEYNQTVRQPKCCQFCFPLRLCFLSF